MEPQEPSLPGTPWFFIRSREATKQDKIPSQVGCLAKRTHVEVGGAAEALHSPGGLWQPLRRALMEEDPVDPEHSEAMKQQELGAEDLGIYTQTLQRMPRFIQITTGYLHRVAPGQPRPLLSSLQALAQS